MNPTQKAMFAALLHVHSRKPAPGRMPATACGTQALPGEKLPVNHPAPTGSLGTAFPAFEHLPGLIAVP